MSCKRLSAPGAARTRRQGQPPRKVVTNDIDFSHNPVVRDHFPWGIGYELALVLAHSSPLRDGDGAVRVDREEPVVAARRKA